MSTTRILAALVIVAALAGGAYFVLQRPQPAPAAAPAAPAVPATAPAAPAPAPQAAETSADCLFPGPRPVVPYGADSSAEDMKLAHNAIQGYVLQLEAYQACRNAQIEQAGPGLAADKKEALIEAGNQAVDEANAMAQAFKQQIAAYHAKHPEDDQKN